MSASLGPVRTFMKKTFPLHIEGKHPDRVLDALKHELHKYVKRERRRALPAGVAFWDFDCKFGMQRDDAEVVHLSDFNARLNAAQQAGATQVYVEIVAKPGVRQARVEGQPAPGAGDGTTD